MNAFSWPLTNTHARTHTQTHSIGRETERDNKGLLQKDEQAGF